jgi:hypothetical protein
MNAQFYTNVRATNIFYNGDFNNVLSQTKLTSSSNSNAQ